MHGLLAGAGHAVVVGTVVDGQHCQLVQIFIVIADDLLAVALANAETGLTAGVDSLDHAGAAGSDVDIALCQHFVGCLHAAEFRFDDLDQVSGSAQSGDLLADHVNGLLGDVLCRGMGSDNAGVTALDGHHAVCCDGDDGVGAGHNAADNTHGLCHDANAGFVTQVLDVADGLLAAHDVPLSSGGSDDLADLHGSGAIVGLIVCFQSQFFTGVIDGLADGADDLVDGQLIQSGALKFLLCSLCTLNQAVDIFFCSDFCHDIDLQKFLSDTALRL